MVGASDLVLVRSAIGAAVGEFDREDVCSDPTGPDPGAPDGVVDTFDLVCVRGDLGLGMSGLYDGGTAAGDPDAADQPKPDKAFSLHGLPYDHATGLIFARARFSDPVELDPTGRMASVSDSFESFIRQRIQEM